MSEPRQIGASLWRRRVYVFREESRRPSCGRLFFWYFALGPNKEKYKQKIFKLFFAPLLCVPKEAVPPRKGTPGVSRPATGGIPSPGT